MENFCKLKSYLQQMKFFKRHLIPKKSFFKRLFRLPDKKQFLPDLSNLLASLDLHEVRMFDVNELYEKYRINVSKDFVNEREQLFLDYVTYCISIDYDRDLLKIESTKLQEILKLEMWQLVKLYKKLRQLLEEQTHADEILDSLLIIDKE